MNFIANLYSITQNVIMNTLRNPESIINFKAAYPRPSEFAILSNIDTTMEDPIVPLPADSMVKEIRSPEEGLFLSPEQ